MPEKSLRERAVKAKRQGTTMMVKKSDVGMATKGSRHATKKSGSVVSQYKFSDRTVSARAVPGLGNVTRSKKLPLPETGSSTSRRRTLPAAAAAQHRKGPRTKTAKAR